MENILKRPLPPLAASWAGFAAVLCGIAALRGYSYLLFHTFAELFSVVIAATYGVIAWHARRLAEKSTIGTLGIAYLFVAVLDTVHTLAYAGMGIFSGYGYPANQVWVLARLLEATALCVFPFVEMRRSGPFRLVFLSFFLVAFGGLASIFVFRVFPVCFLEGSGQTPFKIGAEICVVLLLAAAALILFMHRKSYENRVFRCLLASMITTALSELCFMVYEANYDYLNLTGHLLKILSFYLVYRAVVVACLERPQELIFGELAEAANALMASNEAKDSFISILSHDLRSPLSGINSLSRGMSEAEDQEIAASGRAMFREIAKSSGAALLLVERVLAWARSRSGLLHPKREEVDLAEAAVQEGAVLAESARGKGVFLEMESATPARCLGDADLVGTIARNLVQNALKFTPAGGTVRVRTRGEGPWAILEVADEGVGMSAQQLSRLFDPLVRSSTAGTAGEKGTGFGLVLCAELAARMGGSLDAESEPGKGSVFRLSLPGA